MECPTCLLKYVAKKRIPHILSCGHSLCSQCLQVQQCCFICESRILKNSKINYSLLEVIQKDQTNIDKLVKVCLTGSSGGGKTSLIRMLTNKQYSQDICSTIGFDFTFQDRKVQNNTIRYQFWDSAGQERYQAISPIHYKNANAIILVYDVNENEDVNKLTYWLHQIEKYCPKEAKILLIGNKTDLLEGKISKPFEMEVWEMIKSGKIIFQEVSCRSQIGCEKIWTILGKFFLERNSKTRTKSEVKIREEVDKKQKVTSIESLQFKKYAKKKEFSCC